MSEKEERVQEGVNWTVAAVIALLIAGGGGTYYFYNQYQGSQQELAQVKAAAAQGEQQADVKATVDAVGQLMELPADETPTIATIKDTEKLKDHAFLSKGKSDDVLLIYTGASKLVVMYRPSTKKIVAVGMVTIQQAAGGETGGGEEK